MPRKPTPPGQHTTIRVDPMLDGRKLRLGDGEKPPRGTQYRAVTDVREFNGKMRRIERWGPSKNKAQLSLQAALTDLVPAKQAKLDATSRFTVAADLWLGAIERKVKSGVRSGTTLDRYRSNLNAHVRPALGELRLHEVDVPRLEALMDALEDDGYSASLRRQCRAVVSGVLQLAVSKGAIPLNPANSMNRIEGDTEAPRSLLPHEVQDLLAKLDADRYARQSDLPDLVRLMLNTGMRIGEALGLRWCDVDLVGEPVEVNAQEVRVPVVWVTGNVVPISGQGLVRNRGKTPSARRPIPLPADAVTLLAMKRPSWADDTDPVFPSRSRRFRYRGNVHRSWRSARDRAGYPWVRPHTFRKTAATEWQKAKLTPLQGADLLGQSQVSTTMNTYWGRGQLHVAAAAALEAAYKPKPEET